MDTEPNGTSFVSISEKVMRLPNLFVHHLFAHNLTKFTKLVSRGAFHKLQVHARYREFPRSTHMLHSTDSAKFGNKRETTFIYRVNVCECFYPGRGMRFIDALELAARRLYLTEGATVDHMYMCWTKMVSLHHYI